MRNEEPLLSEEEVDRLTTVLEDMIPEGYGFVCTVFDEETKRTTYAGNCGPKATAMQLLRGAIHVVDNFSKDERMGSIH